MTVSDIFDFILAPLVDMLYIVVTAASTLSLYGSFVIGFFVVGIIAGAWRLVLKLAQYRGD